MLRGKRSGSTYTKYSIVANDAAPNKPVRAQQVCFQKQEIHCARQRSTGTHCVPCGTQLPPASVATHRLTPPLPASTRRTRMHAYEHTAVHACTPAAPRPTMRMGHPAPSVYPHAILLRASNSSNLPAKHATLPPAGEAECTQRSRDLQCCDTAGAERLQSTYVAQTICDAI